MGGQHPDLSGDTLRATVTETQQDAAKRAVLLRYETGSLSGPDALTVLQALGIVAVDRSQLMAEWAEKRRQVGAEWTRAQRATRAGAPTVPPMTDVRVAREQPDTRTAPSRALVDSSWTVFEACPACRSLEGEPCRNLRTRSAITWPHPGRKQI